VGRGFKIVPVVLECANCSLRVTVGGALSEAVGRAGQRSQFIEDTVEPSYLPGIKSLFIICIRIIRNKLTLILPDRKKYNT